MFQGVPPGWSAYVWSIHVKVLHSYQLKLILTDKVIQYADLLHLFFLIKKELAYLRPIRVVAKAVFPLVKYGR